LKIRKSPAFSFNEEMDVWIYNNRFALWYMMLIKLIGAPTKAPLSKF
jgi:hypothetical protein